MRKIKRNLNLAKYVASFVLAAVVFLLGILIGNQIAFNKLSELQAGIENLRIQMLSLEMRDLLIGKTDVCSIDWKGIWEEKTALGRKVEILEQKFGKNDARVRQQKRLYHLVEIKTWLILQEISKKCGEDLKILLFFYTNLPDDPKGSAKESENWGAMISYLVRKYKEKIYVFAFDINIEDPAMNVLKQIYNVSRAPAIVFEDKTFFEIKNVKELEEIVFS